MTRSPRQVDSQGAKIAAGVMSAALLGAAIAPPSRRHRAANGSYSSES